MFCPAVIAEGVRKDFESPSVAAFLPDAPRVAYGTAGFRTVGSALPPIAYRCAFVVFCRSLCARMATPTNCPVDNHHFLINPATIGDCGVMITASHNPAPDNGLKIVDPDGGMLTISWEADATEVANIRDATAFGDGLSLFARRHLVMGAAGEEERVLYKLLRDRPVRIHVGRDTRPSGEAILAAIKAGVAAMNTAFSPIVFGSGSDAVVVELVDHGILTTPTLHAMVYWNRHHHELPIAALHLAPPTAPSNVISTVTASNPLLTNMCIDRESSGPSAGHSSNNHNNTNNVEYKHHVAHALATPISPSLNGRLLFRSFVSLWQAMRVPTAPHDGNKGRTIVIDCSNGVGSVSMRESLALPIALLPEDLKSNPNIPLLSGLVEGSPAATTVGSLVKAVTNITFKLVHDNVADPTQLNSGCGADHTQKTREPSAAFSAELSNFLSDESNAALVLADMRCLVSGCGSSSEGSVAASSVTTAFCTAVGRRIGFYCFDGDADRVVSFALCPNSLTPSLPGDAAVVPANSSALITFATSSTHFELLDGDRIAVLMSALVRDALRRHSHDPSAAGHHTPTPHPQIGVVQTAYANGASTHYILSKLHIPTVCAATGVKFLHPKAEAMEVGIYFEANGHGTALSSASLYSSDISFPTTTAVCDNEHKGSGGCGPLGAGQVVPPSSVVERSPSSDASSSASTPTTRTVPACVSARAIVPHLWLGGSSAVAANTGFRNLLLLRYLLSQCCGDAVADMLACEVGLATLGWTAFDWQMLYTDLPSITGKTTVGDPSVIKNTADQRQATHPVGLQARIDAIVLEAGGDAVLARSFVRPSGTEPIVRIYSEATTAAITQQIFDRVAEAVRDICGS